MNPPAAIQSAMGRERKPFTYTPGGLDLSEIKSERMARRLMRNAMSQGVPETPSPTVQSPTTPVPAATLNYHNLPVQVFPTFQLPANPKSLLRTRSNPQQQRGCSADRHINGNGIISEEPPTYPKEINPFERRNSSELIGMYYPEPTPAKIQLPTPPPIKIQAPRLSEEPWVERTIDRLTPSIVLEPCLRMPSEILQSNTENKKVKSQKKESHTEESVHVEATVKITKPQKSVSTAVQIERRILPDGTVEETKTTTTNTLIDGKIDDSKVTKETRILSDEEAKAVIEEGSEEEEEIIEEENSTVNGKSQSATTNGNVISENVTGSKTNCTSKTTQETTNKNTGNKTVNKNTKDLGDDSEEEIEEVVVTEYEDEVGQNSKRTTTGSKTTISETKTSEIGSKQTGKSEKQVTTTTKVTTTTTGDSGDEEEEEEEVEEEEEIEEENVTKSNSGKQDHVEVTKSSVTKQTSDIKNTESTQIDTRTDTKTVTTSNKDTEEDEDEEEEYEEIEEVEEEEEVEDISKKTDTEKDTKSQQQTVLSTLNDKHSDEKRKQNVSEESTQITTEEEIVESGSNKDKIDEKRVQKVTEESTQIKTHISTENPIEIHIAKSVNEKENTQTKKQFTTTTKSETITSTGAPQVHSTNQTETGEVVSTLPDTPFTHPISTQSELHRIENIITVNKSTKSLDNSYEQMTQQGLPTVKTYFAPSREKISTSPQPSKPYTPTFSAPEKQPERRHSLLLERLSMERQFAPPENYHNTYNYSSNHTTETSSNQWNQEPQSEVVIASNIKPSSINNSKWYTPSSTPQYTQPSQQNNVIYNNIKPTTPTPQPSWQQPPIENSPYSVPLYHTEPSYAPKESSWGSNNLSNLDRLPSLNSQSTDYSFSNKQSTFSQENAQTQQYHSGYVPPPWEADNITYKQPSFYEPQTAPVLSSNTAPLWKSPTIETKKRPPVAYQPPAPNASFVKQASPAPLSKPLPGRKTYYSEYERRYISVPESTYIPTETKVQPQWDPSPQYYYDNAEPAEQIEPPWRKELREFTEKSTREDTTAVVQPPWQDDKKYSNNTSYTSTQQTWSQTIRPKSWRETSYESESLHTSQEWPRPQNKRPISALVNKGFSSPSVDRTRGVSVDRYNSNNYQSPEFAPTSSNGYKFSWETQEQASFSPQPKQGPKSPNAYHNAQVPAYHSRPTESRDYQVSYQPRWSSQGRENPVQSRSFKYLQMLTGTEDGVEEPQPFVAQQPHHAVTKPRRI